MSTDLLKIMIVDDEHPVRELFKMCIDWKGIGMVIAGEASSGIEALELMEEIKPDIIFTDICMPFMDGLEFSKAVVEQYPHIKIIVLTAHDEFEFAKKGIKVGISDFLLKPINGEEIRKVALGIKEKILAEREHNFEYNRLKKQLNENYPFLKERLLNEMLNGKITMEDLKEQLDYFSINLLTGRFQVAAAEVAHSEMKAEPDEEDRLILELQGLEIIKQYFKEDKAVSVFLDIHRKIVILNNSAEIDLMECAEQIKYLLINRLKCFVSIGIGSSYIEFKGISRSYTEACDALRCKVFLGWNQVIDFKDICFTEEKFVVNSGEVYGIGTCIKAGLGEKALEHIDTIYNEIHAAKGITIEQIRVVSVNIISSLLNAVNDIGLSYSDILDAEAAPYVMIFRIDNLPKMKRYMMGVIRGAIDIITEMRSKKIDNTIREIMEYLKENLSDPELSLVTVAKRFYKNSSYLSRIFKQEAGLSFIEYLTKLRMEKAISLIRNTDMKSYEISEAVGIPDPNYFSICFKKFTGMSANDFRKRGF